jgi:hypothetical protein
MEINKQHPTTKNTSTYKKIQRNLNKNVPSLIVDNYVDI